MSQFPVRLSFFSLSLWETVKSYLSKTVNLILSSTRAYTLSDIINAVIEAGFTFKRFEEHPDWVNKNIPGEFTILAQK
jgi:hypothetical protein